MDCEFVIPLKKEDLLESREGQYSAKRIDIKTAWKQIGENTRAITEKGCLYILDHFDLIFSILYESQDVSFDQLRDLWDSVIYRLLEDLRRCIQEALQNDLGNERMKFLNTLVMNVYIFSMFIKTYEEKLAFNADNLLTDKKSKNAKSKSKGSRCEAQWDWNSSKKVAFSLINGVLEENISALWSPPVVEEQFVNLVASCCYKAFESPEITQAKLKPLKDTISQVLALLVNQYNHIFNFVPRCVQLLKDHEHTANALSNAVLVMVIEYKCTSLLPKLLKDMTDSVRDDDVQGLGKAVASFITNIAENNPEAFLSSLKILTKCLAFEPYIMRNAVLVSFTEVLLKCYTSNYLSNDERKSRDNLLKYLHNHIRDQSSYVGSKSLQLWAKLASNHAIPAEIYIPVLRTAKARLWDSSSFVVKSAIQFFTAILKDNIYAGKFNISAIKSELKKAKSDLKSIQSKQLLSITKQWEILEPDLALKLTMIIEQEQKPEGEEVPQAAEPTVPVEEAMIVITKLLQKKHFSEAYDLLKMSEIQYPDSQEIRCNMNRSDEVEYYIATFKKIFSTTSSNYNPHEEEYNHQNLVVTYLEDAMAFAILISDASKEIEQHLFSQSTMEALEAIEFFRTAYQFSALDSPRAVREMIVLFWSKVPGVKEAITAAFKTLYLESSQPTTKGKAMQAASRLIKMLKELDLEQKSALEDLIHQWYKDNELDKEFIQVLWEVFSKKLPQQFKEESDRVSAVMILDMLAEKNPLLVSLNLQVLIETGLLKSNDILLIEYSCNMISKLSDYKADRNFVRLSPDHEVFKLAVDIVLSKFVETPPKGFMGLSSAVLKMIYKVCYNPLKVSDHLLEELYKILKEDAQKQQGENDKEKSSDDQNCTLNESCYNVTMLTSLIFVFGEQVFRKWKYFDRDVYNCLKKQINMDVKLNESASLEDEMKAENQEAANAALVTSINELCEEFLEIEDSLDSHLKTLVVKACFGLGRSVTPTLQQTAIASLAKIMMASSSFCENNIQVFMTIMEKSTAEAARANAVLGFGDLLMRFPNMIEPWTNHLYARLKDNSILVRSNTVIVLCHLINREMIKVRGQIAELCLCLEDPEPSISSRVRFLLKNLSQKGNTLYNVIIDIISRLSNPERDDPIPSPVFNRIIKFILGLIGKERQNDLLVEKLCVRLKESTNEAQWSQLSFCLAQLSFSEKSLKKLIDFIPSLNERLFCTDVYNAIEGIFIHANKAHFTKPQFKELATEGLDKLEEMVTTKESSSKKKSKGDGEDEEKTEDDESGGVSGDPDDKCMSVPRPLRSERKVPRSVTRSAAKRVVVSETPKRSSRTRRKL